MLRIIILGPPGSGKGTRAKIIGDIFRVPVITTGDMLREAVTNGTKLGKVAKGYMEKGELVPDDLVNSLIKERLSKKDTKSGFILDGYPRSVKQAEALDGILYDTKKKLDHVIHVSVDDQVIISRLSQRRSCPNCGAVYHLRDKPPRNNNCCDNCGQTIIQREDDKEDVIKHRLEVYRDKTQPLLDWYDKKGKVKTISGDLDIKEIPTTIKQLLKK